MSGEDAWLEAAYEDANGGAVDTAVEDDDTDVQGEEYEARKGGYCEDYPCCGHTPADPCDGTGPTADDYYRAYERGSWDPYDDYYEEP